MSKSIILYGAFVMLLSSGLGARAYQMSLGDDVLLNIVIYIVLIAVNVYILLDEIRNGNA